MRTLGVDGCAKGWVAISSDLEAYFARSIAALVEVASADAAVDVIAIDMPIGLPDRSDRAADRLARAEIGARRSSVFPTPVRAAVAAPDAASAREENVQATGKGISAQSYAIVPKMREVDAFARTTASTVIEIHPEVSFATLAGRPLAHPKSTWAGFDERRALLAPVGLLPIGDLGEAGERAAPDDILDAAVACWTATRYAEGRARSLPPTPERFSDGLAAAIWA